MRLQGWKGQQGWKAVPAVVLLASSLSFQQQSSLQKLLTDLRDTTTAVSAAAWDFNRDLKSAGPETVIARATFLRDRCVAARAALPPATTRLASRQDAAPVLEAIRALDRALAEQCERGFRPAGLGQWPDSLRAWGPFRTNQITQAIRRYDIAAEK